MTFPYSFKFNEIRAKWSMTIYFRLKMRGKLQNFIYLPQSHFLHIIKSNLSLLILGLYCRMIISYHSFICDCVNFYAFVSRYAVTNVYDALRPGDRWRRCIYILEGGRQWPACWQGKSSLSGEITFILVALSIFSSLNTGNCKMSFLSVLLSLDQT